ncbi:MAG: hypothetical protein LH650_05870, partial [Chloroflexi bacterium]|nr:hypothetical protein [Chloroflexota bacterium]
MSHMSNQGMRVVAMGASLFLGAAAVPGLAASPAPSSAAEEGGTSFASEVAPYSIVLPPGWTVVSVAPQDTADLFQGPDAGARVGTRSPVTGQTVADRVASNRADLAAEGCTSDPAGDRATTLGGEAGIAWSYRCSNAVSLARNVIHGDTGYRLSVTVPNGSEAEAPGLLDQLAGTFAFTAALASASPVTDLAAVAASLQGTWRTEWAPVELWIASVEAAGLDPASQSAGSWKADMARAKTA